MTISILLADDHQIFRESLRLLLSCQPDFEVVGEAADGQQAIDLADQLQPHIAVLDLTMPDLNGLEAIRQIKSHHPKILVVVLSAHEEDRFVAEAFRFGADAYVYKEQSVADLVHAVRTVLTGERYVSPLRAAKTTLPTPPEWNAEPSPTRGVRNETLTTREQQVLSLTAQGYSNAEIGTRLNISARTVETHRGHLMLKLGLKSRLDLMRYAQERQLS